ncbi:glycoside hydrolase family 3 C-terminal domain-containing protein, partial [Escherichia coli]|nr:glycoside hydrolase family 3 C-terminal domain-containing protein [Escherichia coli]
MAIDEAVQSDVVIVAVGENDRTCGEFFDRTDLNLPGKQHDLIRAFHSTGKPIVLVLLNGRPLSTDWEAHHIPAI